MFDLKDLVTLLEYENAQDLVVISVPEELQYVDHMVIVSARSKRHTRALAETVRWCVSNNWFLYFPAKI